MRLYLKEVVLSERYGTHLGLDVGTRRVGVAGSDPRDAFALPLDTIEASDVKKACMRIAKIARERQAHIIVVGWPLSMDGREGRAVRRVEEFVTHLKKHLDGNAEFVYWDERMTTMGAESILVGADVSRQRRKQVVDKIAATMILDGYLQQKQSV